MGCGFFLINDDRAYKTTLERTRAGFVVLIAAVADGAVERMDKNCPTMHIYDPSSNWALSASRLMYNFHTRALGEHTDGNAIPYSDPRPFRLLNNFVAEFVGGHDRELESRCFQP